MEFAVLHSRPPRASVGAATIAMGAASLLVLLFAAGEPEPQFPEWAEVTRVLETDAWPLVKAARYDPANHFVLVDVHSGISADVAERLACHEIRNLVDAVDATAGFALYQAPDLLLAHRDDCVD